MKEFGWDKGLPLPLPGLARCRREGVRGPADPQHAPNDKDAIWPADPFRHGRSGRIRAGLPASVHRHQPSTCPGCFSPCYLGPP